MLREFSWGALERVPSFFAPGGSQERSWTRLGVDLARNRAPRAKQRVLGSIVGTILAPKMMCFFVFVPYAVFIVFFVCFPSSCLALFLRFLAVRAKGRKAKFDTLSERRRVFSRCTLAPALPQGRQPMVKKDFKNIMEKRQHNIVTNQQKH